MDRDAIVRQMRDQLERRDDLVPCKFCLGRSDLCGRCGGKAWHPKELEKLQAHGAELRRQREAEGRDVRQEARLRRTQGATIAAMERASWWQLKPFGPRVPA